LKFCLFCIFLETSFWVSKISFAPLISAILSPIRLKIFLVGLQLISEGCFFIHADNSYPSKSVGFAKFLGCKKSIDFPLSAVFCFSCLKYLEFFNEKKNTPPKSVEVLPKKFSARSDFKQPRKGGRNYSQVFDLGVSGSR
jgi:hypothetical protein